MVYRIGIDVGGTNTDAVLLNDKKNIISQNKQTTTTDIMTGIEKAIEQLFIGISINKSEVTQAMLGTTHCTNAIVERRGLNSVAHIRLGAPATLAVEPLANVPEDLRLQLGSHIFIVEGGLEYDGSILSALNEDKIRTYLHTIQDKVDSISICGVFSPVSGEQETRVAEIIREELGNSINISMSHQIGGIGLLERENASILNAALFKTAYCVANGFISALAKQNIQAEVFLSQNDGTLMNLEHALSFPILTIASGPTNSIRGASYLADLQDAIVVDIGGTTTDIGIISHGILRESLVSTEIGGMRTNFRMPDISSIGLGGGTIIHLHSDNDFTIGPESVGHQLTKRALVFGGDMLTITDIAVAKGLLNLGDAQFVQHLSCTLIDKILNQCIKMIEDVIDRMYINADLIPVILVGGGAVLIPDSLRGTSKVVRPKYCEIANAVGVSIAQASGEVEIIAALKLSSLDAALAEATKLACTKAISAGAIPDSVHVIDIEVIPLAYMPNDTVRIKAKASGIIGSSSQCIS
ncbi:MAG: hydantoinase/oxoprolinase family protein [Candidatus Rickettsia vulgarisii]